MTEGKEPEFTNDALQRELRKMHIDLELEVVAQIPPQTGNKNSGRQVPPITPTNTTKETPMTQTATPTDATNAAPAAVSGPSPEDRVVARLDALNARLAPPPMWKTGVAIGGSAVLGVGVVTAGVYLGMRLAAPAAPGKPKG